jgi:hypothetical protein
VVDLYVSREVSSIGEKAVKSYNLSLTPAFVRLDMSLRNQQYLYRKGKMSDAP